MQLVKIRTEVLLLFGGIFSETCEILCEKLDNVFLLKKNEYFVDELASTGIFKTSQYPAAAVASEIHKIGKDVDPYLQVMLFKQSNAL